MSRINPLRRFYNFLSEQLSKDDERSLRNLLRGVQLTTRELENLESPFDIFIKLEQYGHISETDLALLKELLGELKRPPLVAEVERVEKELQESNESKIKSTGCVGAEGGNVAASRAVDIEERGKMTMSMMQDPDCNTTNIQHRIDKDHTYNLLSSLETGLQHISLIERKEDFSQDVKHDQLTNSAALSFATSTADDKDVILECQETLRKEYKRLSHILPLPWLDGADSRLKLEDIYTRLDLQNSDGTIVQRKDIFSCSGDDENPKRILIEGEPGYGKSTFCKMIAYDWAKSKTEYLRNFKLLFLLELKDLQEYHSENNEKHGLKDFIFDLVLRDVKEKHTLWNFIENNQIQVCFIFDGLDEVSSSNLPVDFRRMLQQKWPLLPYCHVIVTSRIIRDVNSGHMYDSTLSIKGFDEVKAELFVNNYLGFNSGKAQKISNAERFIQELRGSPSRPILNHLMQSPLNTLMLCEIWKQNRKLPQFITEIYKAIVEYTVKRYCENIRQYRTFNDTEMKKTLLFLGKKSYEGLLSERGQVLMSNDEIKSHSHILQLGFLSKPSTSFQGYSFMHLIYQEYFAALYIADLCSTNPSKFADIIDVSVFSKRKCSNITLVFVAGLLKDKQSKMFEVWYRKIDRTVNAFDPILILQESGFVTAEIISLCAKVLPCSLYIDTTMLGSPQNKRRLEIIKRLLQCSDLRSDTVCIKVSASNPNACRQIFSACRVCLKANSKKIEVRLKIDCDLSQCAIKHFLNDIAFESDPYTDDIANLHIRNHKDIDILHSIQDILDVFSKINAKTHVISGLPFRLKLIDVVLLKLNDARSLHSVRLVFGEQQKIFIFGILNSHALQIASRVGKFNISCNIDDLNFDIVNFQEKLECFTPGTVDRVELNIKLTCDFLIESLQPYVENILSRFPSVNIDELTLELLIHSEMDIKEISPQINAIMKRVSSISARTLTIQGFPVGNLELIEKVHAHLSSSKSLKSIHVAFTESSETYKVHIVGKFGKFNISYENQFIDFDLASFHQLLSQYASLNHTTVILNVRVTCLGSVICMSNIYDITRRMESVPIDRLVFEFSEYAMEDLTDVCSRLIDLLQTLSLICARELVITGLPMVNEEFITKIHKVIVTNKSPGSVRIEFKEKLPTMRQKNVEITAKVGSLESSFTMNDLNFDFSRLHGSLSELTCQSTVIFDITITCDFRQNDVGSNVKNLLSRLKYVDIHMLTLRVCGYANSNTKDVHLCIDDILNGFEDISAEQLFIRGLSDEYGHTNLITLLYQRLRKKMIKKVFIVFSVSPLPQPCKGQVITIIADFGKFRIVYDSSLLKFELQSLYQSLSHQASLNNEKVTLGLRIYCDFNDRALDRYIKDITLNMKAVEITQVTFHFFNVISENANRIQNILTNIARVKVQKLVLLGIPFEDLDVFKIVSEPLTKLIPNTVCHLMSRPTCLSFCKLNLLQHSNVIAHCETREIKLIICKASCDLIDFYQRFLQICLPDERSVKIVAHVSYDGNGQQADSDIQYLKVGNKSVRFAQLSFLDRRHYSKLSVESSDTIDVFKTLIALDTEIIHYANCPSINLEFAKAVLDIMFRGQSPIVVISFREKMNRSRVLDTIKSFENDGLEVHTLELTSHRVSVVGKYVKSPMPGKVVKLIFAAGHSLNIDSPRDDVSLSADSSPFQDDDLQDDVTIAFLNICGIDIKNYRKTIRQSQTRAMTLLRQYVSALGYLTDVSVLDGEVLPDENAERHLSEIMMNNYLQTISFKGCNLNKVDRFVIDCIKKTDKLRKNPLRIRLCHAFDSTNISMLKDALEADGFVNLSSVGKKATGWEGKQVEIILIPCNQDNGTHDIKQHPLIYTTELIWCAFNDNQNRRNDYMPFQ